jgi:exopolysaccharide biosynthesis polyprenyl glycosylphosphotransferase
MVPLRRVALVAALKLFDVAAMVAAYLAAGLAASDGSGGDVARFLSMRITVSNLLLFAAVVLLWQLALGLAGVYDSKRLTSRRREIVGLLEAVGVASALAYLVSAASGVTFVRGPFLPVLFAASAAAIVASRLILRRVLVALRRRGRNLRFTLIVGTNRRAIAFARGLDEGVELGYRLVGFVDDRVWDTSGEFERSGHPLVGAIEALPDVLRRRVIDEVFVFLPLRSYYAQASRIVAQCGEQGIPVTFPSSLFELKGARVSADDLGGGPVMTIAKGRIAGWAVIAKRVIDALSAAALLVLLAPVFVVVAVLVKATSPGPVFFVQERIGLNKRRFRMVKFRTMIADAERQIGDLEHLNEATGPVFKIKHDPRITPLGAFLRKTSIDELPQLLNVLRGDISLVGPRPLPVRDYEGFDRDWHRRRFSVRPGITCLWQIGGRSQLSFERWMELDMQYIDNWSLWLDLKILLKTIPVVLRGTGAA